MGSRQRMTAQTGKNRSGRGRARVRRGSAALLADRRGRSRISAAVRLESRRGKPMRRTQFGATQRVAGRAAGLDWRSGKTGSCGSRRSPACSAPSCRLTHARRSAPHPRRSPSIGRRILRRRAVATDAGKAAEKAGGQGRGRRQPRASHPSEFRSPPGVAPAVAGMTSMIRPPAVPHRPAGHFLRAPKSVN